MLGPWLPVSLDVDWRLRSRTILPALDQEGFPTAGL
jgi:hypothetical protein